MAMTRLMRPIENVVPNHQHDEPRLGPAVKCVSGNVIKPGVYASPLPARETPARLIKTKQSRKSKKILDENVRAKTHGGYLVLFFISVPNPVFIRKTSMKVDNNPFPYSRPRGAGQRLALSESSEREAPLALSFPQFVFFTAANPGGPLFGRSPKEPRRSRVDLVRPFPIRQTEISSMNPGEQITFSPEKRNTPAVIARGTACFFSFSSDIPRSVSPPVGQFPLGPLTRRKSSRAHKPRIADSD